MKAMYESERVQQLQQLQDKLALQQELALQQQQQLLLLTQKQAAAAAGAAKGFGSRAPAAGKPSRSKK